MHWRDKMDRKDTCRRWGWNSYYLALSKKQVEQQCLFHMKGFLQGFAPWVASNRSVCNISIAKLNTSEKCMVYSVLVLFFFNILAPKREYPVEIIWLIKSNLIMPACVTSFICCCNTIYTLGSLEIVYTTRSVAIKYTSRNTASNQIVFFNSDGISAVKDIRKFSQFVRNWSKIYQVDCIII